MTLGLKQIERVRHLVV